MPDLIVLDWDLPTMPGMAFVRALRTQPGGQHPFILFCTTENDAGAIAQARASCGAFGHMRVNRLNEYHSFAVVLNNAGGDNQKCLIDAARSMVEGVEYEVPASVAAGPETLGFDDDVLRDCVKLLRHRESGLHRRLAAELADAMAGGADDFTAWNDRAELAQEFVEAHLARTVTEYFQDSAAECPDPQRRRLLRSLCELFALGRIAGHEGWYRETGFLPFSSAWSPSAAAGRVRDRLVPDLETLVRMLEIPPPLVLSPLAGERPVDGIMPSPIVPEMAATNAV
jgi:CheY-like chemotaxis protein